MRGKHPRWAWEAIRMEWLRQPVADQVVRSTATINRSSVSECLVRIDLHGRELPAANGTRKEVRSDPSNGNDIAACADASATSGCVSFAVEPCTFMVSGGGAAGRSAAMGPPRSACRHEMQQIQLDAYVSNRGEPVKNHPRARVAGSSCSQCARGHCCSGLPCYFRVSCQLPTAVERKQDAGAMSRVKLCYPRRGGLVGGPAVKFGPPEP
jgi:hypothetical protein